MIRMSVSLAFGFILGILVALSPARALSLWSLAALALSGAALAAAILRSVWKRRPVSPAWTVLACLMLSFVAGHFRAARHLHAAPPESLRARLAELAEGQTVALVGTIRREPERHGDTQGELNVRVRRMKLDDAGAWRSVSRGNVHVRLSLSARAVAADRALFDTLMHPDAYGYTVELIATHRTEPEPLNPGAPDGRVFLLQNDVDMRCRAMLGDVRVIEPTRGFFVTEFALACKAYFLRVYRQTIRSPAGRLVASARLGSRRSVERGWYNGVGRAEIFRAAGVGRMLSDSELYAIMALLLLFCWSLRRAVWAGLSISILGILTVNPLVLFEPGFLLSFGAVLSIVSLAPVVDRWLSRRRGMALLFSLLWVAAVIAGVSTKPSAAVSVRFWSAAVAALWLLLVAGAALHRRFPFPGRVGWDRVPAPARMFFCASMAILIGMAAPLFAFPFPVVSRPTTAWLAVYYAGVVGVVLLDAGRTTLHGLWARVRPWAPACRAAEFARVALPCALLIGAWLAPRWNMTTCERITCAAVRQYPVVVATSTAKTSLLFNVWEGGDAVGRVVLGVLRAHGSVELVPPPTTASAVVDPGWKSFSAVVALPPSALPRAMIAGALSRVVRLDANGFSWVVLTDATDRTPADSEIDAFPCDVLVLPDRVSRRDYETFATAAARVWRPRVVIVGGDRELQGLDLDMWAHANGVSIAWSTGREGAVTAGFPRPGIMTLETHRSRRRAVIRTTDREQPEGADESTLDIGG